MGKVEIKPGLCFYENNNFDRRKYHVIIVLDEKPEKIVVYKFFGIHKRWWNYETMEEWNMQYYFKNGLFSLKRKR